MRFKIFVIAGLVALIGVAATACGGGGEEVVRKVVTNSSSGETAVDAETVARCAEMDVIKGSGLSFWVGSHCSVIALFVPYKNSLNEDDINAGVTFCADGAPKVPSWGMLDDWQTRVADYCDGFEATDSSTLVALARKSFCDSADLALKIFSDADLEYEAEACDGIDAETTSGVERLQLMKCTAASTMLTNLRKMKDLPDTCQ